jgi:chromosome segregation ATPase
MESVNEIKKALSLRSRTATLDELRGEGRKRVRLIRAEHVAQMISEAVHAAVEHSGLIPPDEVDQLVEKSRREFKNILKEREQDAKSARDIEEQFEQREHELGELRTRFSELSKALTTTRLELEQTQSELQAVREMPAPAAAPPDFSEALEKLTGSLNDRLEKIGKKMGVSAAVEDDSPVDFGSMFDDDFDSKLESNMDNIKVKQKAVAGIAANLAKLKKLKGGG